jgi:hypothetical protein
MANTKMLTIVFDCGHKRFYSAKDFFERDAKTLVHNSGRWAAKRKKDGTYTVKDCKCIDCRRSEPVAVVSEDGKTVTVRKNADPAAIQKALMAAAMAGMLGAGGRR